MTIHIIYSLHGSEKDATQLLLNLLSKKMVACGNVFPCQSHFEWKGTMDNAKEWVLIVKTSQKKVRIACEWLENHHPYEIPAILTWSVEANVKYAKWVEEQTNSV
jgi:periplasmic divalent cation tolerance protein